MGGAYTEAVSLAPKLLTYEDLLALPQDAPRAEIVAGGLHAAPAPLPRHAFTSAGLAGEIGGRFGRDGGGGPGGWWILPEVDVRFSRHDIVRPDLTGFRRDRLPSPWDTRPIDVVPDWVCEILSPSSAAMDTVIKARLYADHGVPHYWIVDPRERTLEARVLERGRWVVTGSYAGTDRARVEPFEAVELDLASIFPPEPPPTEPTP